MQDVSVVPEFNINVDSFAAGEDLVDCVELIGFYGFFQRLFVFFDLSLDWVGAAHWSFFLSAVVSFKYPTPHGAVLAKEFGASATEVLDVFEIKFRFAVWVLASGGPISPND